MSRPPILIPVRYWACPDCPARHVTRMPQAHQPMHPCGPKRGLEVPYVETDEQARPLAGRCRQVVVEREDYVGGELGVRHDADGRAVMAVVTERDDGNDVAVFAPTATAGGRGERVGGP